MWTPVPGFEQYYEASRCGYVRSIRKNKLLKPSLSKDGYHKIVFVVDGKMIYFRLHRIIGITFISNPEKKPQINHKNGNKIDNAVDNLEWCTPSENTFHAFANNLISKERLSELAKKRLGKLNSFAKKVYQYSLNGTFIKEWESQSEAQRFLKIKSAACISACCTGRQKTAKGFKWSSFKN